MRKYISAKQIKQCDDYWVEPAPESLGRTVYEERNMIDIGVLDHNGDPIMAYEQMDQIGFIRNKASNN